MKHVNNIIFKKKKTKNLNLKNPFFGFNTKNCKKRNPYVFPFYHRPITYKQLNLESFNLTCC